ncbi:MAG: ATPase [Chitinophagia bacterium]|nr:ATPase [Chitinophagia bacterium]
MIIKVVVIGPESTGKSSLCEQLANHYNTEWVKEYAREYLLANGTEYSYDNLLEIAEGQFALENAAIQAAKDKIKNANESNSTSSSELILIDTNMYVLKVWCEFVFDKCHPWILNQIVENSYDLYLLCNIDLPWVKDELREYPDLEIREKLYHHYKDLLINQSTPWVNISGNYQQRLEVAIKAIDSVRIKTSPAS